MEKISSRIFYDENELPKGAVLWSISYLETYVNLSDCGVIVDRAPSVNDLNDRHDRCSP